MKKIFLLPFCISYVCSISACGSNSYDTKDDVFIFDDEPSVTDAATDSASKCGVNGVSCNDSALIDYTQTEADYREYGERTPRDHLYTKDGAGNNLVATITPSLEDDIVTQSGNPTDLVAKKHLQSDIMEDVLLAEDGDFSNTDIDSFKVQPLEYRPNVKESSNVKTSGQKKRSTASYPDLEDAPYMGIAGKDDKNSNTYSPTKETSYVSEVVCEGGRCERIERKVVETETTTTTTCRGKECESRVVCKGGNCHNSSTYTERVEICDNGDCRKDFRYEPLITSSKEKTRTEYKVSCKGSECKTAPLNSEAKAKTKNKVVTTKTIITTTTEEDSCQSGNCEYKIVCENHHCVKEKIIDKVEYTSNDSTLEAKVSDKKSNDSVRYETMSISTKTNRGDGVVEDNFENNNETTNKARSADERITKYQTFGNPSTKKRTVHKIIQENKANAQNAEYKVICEGDCDDFDNNRRVVTPEFTEESFDIADYVEPDNDEVIFTNVGNEETVINDVDIREIKISDNTVLTWEAEEGENLRELLTKWSAMAGWKLLWQTNRNYVLSAGVMFKGKFADVSSALVRAFARARPAPIATYYKGNRVIVVETMENENAY